MLMFFSESFFSSEIPSSAAITLPSNPSFPPDGMLSERNSSVVGTPGSPILKSLIPEPSSWWSACMKYLPSVQRPASSFVITTVPAEPVNPDMYALVLKYSPTYSL